MKKQNKVHLSNNINLMSFPSVGEAFLENVSNPIRKWLLRRLLPKEAFDTPPESYEIGRIEKGTVLTDVTIHMDGLSDMGCSPFDVGTLKKKRKKNK